MRHAILCLRVVCGILILTISSYSLAGDGPVVSTASLATKNLQEDFPAMCLDSKGTPWVVYIQHDGKADTLKVAKKTKDGLKALEALAGPGIIFQPSLACDGKGSLWAVWSELDVKDKSSKWKLYARRIEGGKAVSKRVQLNGDASNPVFSDAQTDRSGRVWVVWQTFNHSLSDIYTKFFDPAKGQWSDEIRVTSHVAGDWEPRLAFGQKDEATIVFDSSRNDNFDVYLATVQLDGKVELTQLTKSPRYEGRPSIAASPDGKSFWIAWENGKLRWGKDSRGVGGTIGLNANKRLDVVHYDIASGKITPAMDVMPVLRKPGTGQPKAGKQPAKKPKRKPRRGGGGLQAVNLPELIVDAQGNPWLTSRSHRGGIWKIFLTKYDAEKKSWTRSVAFPNSTFGQDRRCSRARDKQGRLWFAWPSDRRTTKKAQVSGIYLAQVDTGAALASVSSVAAPAKKTASKVAEVFGASTPERARKNRHEWTFDDQKYGLYFGDFHRHTDVSNCRTPHDGCIVEQFRYAYDVGKLDFLGTSDHTDIGKIYDPYEWWCNQKLADVFQTPGFFNTFYVYEREQRWPWGHRNVVFTERGAPIVYIKRSFYKNSPWQKDFPVGSGAAEISPQELWKVLRAYGKPVSVISHTGATGMGTDWDRYKQIDAAVENLVEIYQGARVSYEGLGTPQPKVGLPGTGKVKLDHPGGKHGKDFGKYNKGVYQNALHNGHRLGVFASSDHISTHASFGGVYAKEFTRLGILKALNARRTIAATDKIFLEFSCNGHLLGSIFETDELPKLKVSVFGTAPLARVTIVRNEKNYKAFTTNQKDFKVTFTDPSPIVGENRYYIRVEQTDGNMAWASPVWVTFKKK